MQIKDFIFSYNQIIYNFFFIKKNFFKGVRKIFNFPVKYLIYCLSIFFTKKNINLDDYKINLKNLNDLFYEFNSDKAKKLISENNIEINGHNYSIFYEKYFEKYKKKKNLTILEIGSQFGSSAAAFYFYFQNPTIIASDINPFAMKVYSNNIRKIYIDTQSEKIVENFIKYLNCEFDIIIDDGSHSVRDQLISLKYFYPYLKSEGIYVIEDLDHYKVSPHLNPDQEVNTTVEVLKAIKDGKTINSKYLQKNDFENITKGIKYINFEKGDYNQKGVNISSIVFMGK